MNFFDLVNISERNLEIINPLSAEKVRLVGRALQLRPDQQVIDFGCGYAEPLLMWVAEFQISGLGIDIRPEACDRARQKAAARRLDRHVRIWCGRGAEYQTEERFDAAVCLGASFIWKGFENTLKAMRVLIRKGGRIAIGEPYWNSEQVPAHYRATDLDVHTERELFELIRQHGLDVEYIVRSSHDDWDIYEAGNWAGSMAWMEEHSDHPERDQVLRHMRETQARYFTFGREHEGWAVYVLREA